MRALPAIAPAFPLALAFTLAGCTSSPSPFSPFPLPVDMDSGPVLIAAQVEGTGEPLLTASVDTLAPLTVIDRLRLGTLKPGDLVPPPRRREVTLTLLAPNISDPGDGGADPALVPRLLYSGASVLELHPCVTADRALPQDPCHVGTSKPGVSSQREIQAIVGADLLARGAVRFDVSGSQLSFLPDIAGDDQQRGAMCEAVFSSPFRGGGTLVVGGAEVPFNGRRIVLGGCWINQAYERQDCQDIDDPSCDGTIAHEPGFNQGLDALFAVSTGLGPTMVTRSAYEEYVRQIETTAPAYDSLPAGHVYVPSSVEPIPVRRASMQQLALVGGVGGVRGPCSERYANAYLRKYRRCSQPRAEDKACPCSGQATFCRTAAVLELGSSIEVAVVEDTEPMIQALRDELRPGLPELTGILGANALVRMELDVDYPNNRVIARCIDSSNMDRICTVRPAVITRDGIDETCGACPQASVLQCGS